MKKIVILIFLFVAHIGSTQNVPNDNLDKLVSNSTKELIEKKIDTICIYESYCVGCEITFDSSRLNDVELCRDELINQPVYIFWKEKGITFFTKINSCFKYSEIEVSDDELWKIYFSNKSDIKKEKIKNFEYETYKNGKKRQTL